MTVSNTQPSNPESSPISTERAVRLLRDGKLYETRGLLPWSSNYTFLVAIRDGELDAPAIYKPRRGERPLWDFPDGTLCQREVAAFHVSEALGWHIVPPTVLRDGPQGVGSLQLYVGHDPEQNYFTFGPQFRSQLMRIVLFDHLLNNADRKGGHCLLSDGGHIWAIDHGICFHAQPKLRTVIWDFAGEPIPPDLLKDTASLCERLSQPDMRQILSTLLSRAEIEALYRRAEQLVAEGIYPHPGPGRNYPWPPV
jgi:uncharacterized repeat protein (TIGR03843 family)